MNPERYRRVDEVLQQALSQPPESRDSFLREVCAGDEELRREVESLIAHERQAALWPDSPEFGAGLGRARPEPAEPPQPELEGRSLLHYRLLEKIGQGGMGVVYRSEDTHLRRPVAIKVLPPDKMADPERKRRFIQEARAASALNHPNIVTIYDIASADGIDFIVMEYVGRQPLAELITGKGLPIRETLNYAVQIADALTAAHEAGIIHRDLKPSNVMVTEKGLVKVLDFGLAKLTHPVTEEESASDQSSLTRSGLIVGTAAYMSPEQAEGKMVDQRSDIFAFGAVLYEMITGRRAFRGDSNISTLAAVLHEEPEPAGKIARAVPAELERIIVRCLRKEPERRFQHFDDLRVALEELREEMARRPSWKQTVEERIPYPGLASFTEQDATLFFGREAEVTALWKRILERHLVAVIGFSGAGKTSFLRAGVIPARPEGWAAVYATPGANPALALARALIPDLAGDAEAVDGLLGGVTELTQSGDTRRFVASAVRWRSHYQEALVVFDQFEELFSLNPPETQARTAALVEALITGAGIHVVLALRDDFLMRCSEYPPLAPVFESLTPLTALKHEELRRALTEPARLRGYQFENEALVEEIISAVEESRGSLPLLAFAVSKLWEKRDKERKILTRQAYSEIGAVEGALAQHGEATLERIGFGRQKIVREIFRNLVTSQGTRAVMDREELLSVFHDRPAAEEVLRLLVDARLLTTHEEEGKEGETSRHRVEIVHESLLRAWPRLVRWQAQDEEGAVLRDQLRQAAHLWQEKRRTRDLLWTGTAYREFTLWRERYPGALTAIEEDFAGAMVGRARRRRRLQLSALVVAFLALAVVAATVSIFWLKSIEAQKQAQDEARRAEASKLLAVAQARLADDPTEALALATASLELSDTEEARIFAVRTLSEAPPARELAGDPRVPAFSPDGARLAAGGHSEDVCVWNADGSLLARLPGHETSAGGPNEARWAGKNLLVTGLATGLGSRVRVWSLPEGRPLRAVDFGTPSMWGAAPARLFAGTFGSGIGGREFWDMRSWRLPGGEEEQVFRQEWARPGAHMGWFTPDRSAFVHVEGRSLFSRPLSAKGEDVVFSRHTTDITNFSDFRGTNRYWFREQSGRIRVWSFEGPVPSNPVDIVKPETAPETIRPEPSGRWVWEPPGRDSNAKVWSLAALPGARPLTLRRASPWQGAVCDFHPSGNWLVCSTRAYSRLTFWPLAATPASVVDGYRAFHRIVGFSPDSRWLVTTWEDGRLRLWPLPGSGSSQLRILNAPPWLYPTFDPAGRYIVAWGGGGELFVVPLDGSPARKLGAFPQLSAVNFCEVSPSGRLVAAAAFYGPREKTLRVWDVETGAVRVFRLPEPPRADQAAAPKLTGQEGGAVDGTFDGESTIYTSGHGGIRRWDLETGEQKLVFAGPWVQILPVRKGPTVCAVVRPFPSPGAPDNRVFKWVNLRTGESRNASEELAGFGKLAYTGYLSATCGAGSVLAITSPDGLVRVGRLEPGAKAHILGGHRGASGWTAISQDLRWVASTGEDNTLRLWRMPDLSKPPLHTLPHDELIAKLKSLTNFRAVPDRAAEGGWKIELDRFPGWKDIPTW